MSSICLCDVDSSDLRLMDRYLLSVTKTLTFLFSPFMIPGHKEMSTTGSRVPIWKLRPVMSKQDMTPTPKSEQVIQPIRHQVLKTMLLRPVSRRHSRRLQRLANSSVLDAVERSPRPRYVYAAEGNCGGEGVGAAQARHHKDDEAASQCVSKCVPFTVIADLQWLR